MTFRIRQVTKGDSRVYYIIQQRFMFIFWGLPRNIFMKRYDVDKYEYNYARFDSVDKAETAIKRFGELRVSKKITLRTISKHRI